MSFTPTGVLDGLYLKDDFYANDSVADAAIGELNWEIVTIANATTFAYVDGQPQGVMRLTSNGTAQGDGAVIRLKEDALALHPAGGHLRFRVRYPDIAGNLVATNNFRIGFQDVVTAGNSTAGLLVDSAAGVISLVSRSTNGNTSDAAGLTMVKGRWYVGELRWGGPANTNGGPSEALLFIDGSLVAQQKGLLIGSAEKGELSLIHWQTASGGDTLELDVDFIEFYAARDKS